jgi:threonine/homoserine efflux transporter RhtA
VILLGQALTAVISVALVMVVAASAGTTLTARRLPRPQPEA